MKEKVIFVLPVLLYIIVRYIDVTYIARQYDVTFDIVVILICIVIFAVFRTTYKGDK